MNSPSIATVRQLHGLVSAPNPSPAASSAWRLLLTMHGPHATLDDMDGREIRIPKNELIHYVRREIALAEYYSRPVPSAVRLMRAMILDCLKNRYPREGKGNRASRRMASLSLQSRNRRVMALHLNCA